MTGKDGTAATQGNPQPVAGQTPTAAPGTSGGTEKTYTETEFQKAISDAKATMGRDKAVLQKQLDGIKGQFDTLAKQVEEKEMDSVRSDPAKLTAYQSRKALEAKAHEVDEREAAIAAKEAALAEKEAAIKKADTAAAIRRLSSEHGIEEAKLADLGTDDLSMLEKVAIAISGKAPAQTKPALTHVDSGRTKGGASTEGMSPNQLIQFGLDQMRRKGG